MNRLNTPFLLNGLFSLSCGLYGLLNAGGINERVIHLPQPAIIGISAGLVAFGLYIIAEMGKGLKLATGLAISVLDLTWIAVTSVLALIFHDVFADRGLLVLAGINTAVFIFFLAQFAALRKLLKHPDPASDFDHYIKIRTAIHSSRQQFWRVLSDLGRIHEFSPTIVSSDITPGYCGVGTVRQCSNPKSQTWSEEVIAWNEGQSFTVRFGPAPGKKFPFPMSQMNGGWSIVEGDQNTCVDIWFEFTTATTLSRLLSPVIAYMSTQPLTKVVKVMDREARHLPEHL